MRKTRSYLIAATLLAALLLPASAFAQADSEPARVRHFEGSVTVQRAQAGETSEALVNLPLEAGDRMWTGPDGRAEVVLPDGSWLWLAASTTIDVTALAGWNTGEETILRLWSGSLILRRDRYDDVRRPGVVRVDAPTGSAVVAEAGTYRIDLDDEQRFWLSVVQGHAELVAGGVSEPLAAGERSFAEPGTAPARAVAFNTAEQDSFDRWQQDRFGQYAVTERHVAERQYVPRTVVHHVADLEHHGNWGYYDDIGAWGWRPQVAVGWSPYRHGRWVYTHHGWSWVSYAPWGWATSHYGRWHFTSGHWLWFPGRTYGPAWVNWYVSSGYIGWVPLNYWNRPVVSVNFFFGGGGRHHLGYGDAIHVRDRGGRAVAGRGYTSGLDRAWTFVPADRFGSRDVGRVAVERTAVPRQDNSIQVQGPLRPREPSRTLVPSNPTRTAVARGDDGDRRSIGPLRPQASGGDDGARRVAVPRRPTVRTPGSGGDDRAAPRRPTVRSDGTPGSSGIPGTSDRRAIVRPRADGDSRPGDVRRFGDDRGVRRPDGAIVRPGFERGAVRPDVRGDDGRGAVRRPTVRDDYGSRRIIPPPVREDADGRGAIRRPTVRDDYGGRRLIRPPVSRDTGSRGVVPRPTVRGDYGGRSVIRPPTSSGVSSPRISRRSGGSSLLQRIFGRSGGSSLRPPSSRSAPRISSPRIGSPPSSIRSRGSSSPSGSRRATPRRAAKPRKPGDGS